MRFKLLVILWLFFLITMPSQSRIDGKEYKYKFIIMDSPAKLFTMRQFNQNYISAYRILSRELNENIKSKKLVNLLQLGLSFLFVPLTHEEGHRSILTGKGIGAISQPFINSNLAAYVVGVTDNTLINLRGNDLPNYIRLHTGGLESDYNLTNYVESIGSFELDEFDNIKWEYRFRKLAIVQYFLLGLFEIEIDISEEENELERDIVGYDTYSAVRHLHRPKMEFYRYTKFSQLTSEEKKYVKRMGYRSLLNLLNPMIIGISNFSILDDIKLNAGMGYSLAPFGDFIEENIWLKVKSDFNLNFYLRQYQNKKNWFHSFGLKLIDYQFSENVYLSLGMHYWNQPKDYEFFTNESFNGGAFELEVSYRLGKNSKNWLNNIAIDIGGMYKTKGFLPNELYLEEEFGIRLGTTVWY